MSNCKRATRIYVTPATTIDQVNAATESQAVTAGGAGNDLAVVLATPLDNADYVVEFSVDDGQPLVMWSIESKTVNGFTLRTSAPATGTVTISGIRKVIA